MMTRWWNNQGLNFKVAFVITITMVIVLGGVLAGASQYIRSRLWQNEIQKSENLNAIATTLLQDAMMLGRKDSIHDALTTLGQSAGNQQLNSIAVYDEQNALTSFSSGFPGGPRLTADSMPRDIQDPSCWGCHQLPAGERPTTLVVNVGGEEVIRNSAPLYNEKRCQTCHGTGTKILGDIIVDYSQEQFMQSYNTIMVGLSIGLVLAIGLVAVVLYQFTRRIVLNPIGAMANAMEDGVLERQVDIQSGDEIGILARAFNNMSAQLRSLIGGLEQNIAQRTRALETSVEVSRRLTTILDPSKLAEEVVNEVRNAFNYYYTQIYVFDQTGERLVLTAGTGEAGAAMLRRGHSLPRGRGLVGRAAQTNRPVVVSDVSQEAGWLPNDLLPDTRTEVSVPIAVGDQVLGVLDVQDDEVNAITAGDVTMLESVAGQVAISLQNARLYARVEESLQEAQSLVEYAADGILVLDMRTGLFTEANTNAEKIYGRSREDLLKMGAGQVSPPRQPDGRDSGEKAMQMLNIAMQRGVNVFEWVHMNSQGENVPCEVRLVRLPGDQPRVRVSIIDISERKRLEALTTQRARQQEAINVISQKIQAAATIEDAMRVAARELGHALGQKPTAVALDPSALTGKRQTGVND